MVAAISTVTETPQNSAAEISRPPLLPSERENGIKGNKRSIRPRGREIPSRYMSPPCPAVSRRSPSPLISRSDNNNNNNNTSSNPKRSQSVDRRRSVSTVNAASVSVSVSTRSLSVSFQGESFSLPVSRAKAVNTASSNGNRKAATPERRRGGSGEQLGVDQQLLWPSRDRQLVDNGGRSSFDGVLSVDSQSGDVSLGAVNGSSAQSDLTASDTDSVSSGSTSGGRQSVPRGIVASARFWQETNMRLRRLQEPGSVPSISPSTKIGVSRIMQSRKFNDGSVASPRIMSSPIRGCVRLASPSKLMTPSTPSPIRGSSPSRSRSSVAGSLCDTPSVLSYIVDVRRGKVGENRIIDAHQLRLLYNRHLQWRFVNARTDIALLVQKQSVEKNLWNAWITVTGLRDSVRHKRAHLQLLKQKLKLSSILKGQVNYLDEWSLMDKDHSGALQGAIEALKASTLRLPVVGAAIADVQSVKEAVSSAVDVMQATSSSICSLLTKVEEVNSLVSELVNVGAKERALLRQCKYILSALAALEVKDCSLRTHILQLNHLPIA